jgi:ribosomal protein S18
MKIQVVITIPWKEEAEQTMQMIVDFLTKTGNEVSECSCEENEASDDYEVRIQAEIDFKEIHNLKDFITDSTLPDVLVLDGRFYEEQTTEHPLIIIYEA